MSKWEETVMNYEGIWQLSTKFSQGRHDIGSIKCEDEWNQVLVQAQAEISFKAGKQEGIREVVECLIKINKAGGNYYHDGWMKTFRFQIPLEEWQAKLKELELEWPF